jgi:hypothetical protein
VEPTVEVIAARVSPLVPGDHAWIEGREREEVRSGEGDGEGVVPVAGVRLTGTILSSFG